MTSVRYTAERLMEVGAAWKYGTKSVAKRLEAQVDGEELLRFGSAWQEEVRHLRARFAELSAELRRVETKNEQLEARLVARIVDGDTHGR